MNSTVSLEGAYEVANNDVVPFPNKITIEDMQRDCISASTLQSNMVARSQQYNDIRKVEGSEAVPKREGHSSMSVPLVRRQAEWKYPALSEPLNAALALFTVKPRTWQSHEAARQNSILLNYQFSTQLNRVSFIDKYVRRNVDSGFAIIRTGWKREVETRTVSVPIYTFYEADADDLEIAEVISTGLILRDSNPSEYEKLPPNVKEGVEYTLEFNAESGEETQKFFYAVDTGKTEEAEVEFILSNGPTIDLINIQDFKLDPTCGGDIDKAMYCEYTYMSTLSELKQSTQGYKNLDAINFDTNDNIDVAMVDTALLHDNGNQRKRVMVHEYWGLWDIKGNNELKPIVVTYVGNVIIKCELNPYPDGKFPFELSEYNPDEDSVFGDSDTDIIADHQRTSGALLRSAIEIIGRSAIGQTAFPKGMLDPINKRKFESQENFEYNPAMGDIRQTIHTMVPPDVPNSIPALMQQQSTAAESLTGTKSFGEGMSSSSLGDVAAGIKGVLDATAKRELSILRRLASTLARVGAKVMAMNKVFLTPTEVVRITNEPDNKISMEDNYTTIYRDQLQGNFDVTVEVNTAEEDDMRASQIAMMLQTLGNTIDPMVTMQLLAEYSELRKLPHIAKQFREWEPQPDPMQEVNLAKAQAEVAKLESEANLKNAQAEYYRSLTTGKQLDAIEQSEGVKHQRDVEKIQSQAESQGKLAEKQAQLDLAKKTVENGFANGAKAPIRPIPSPDIDTGLIFPEKSILS